MRLTISTLAVWVLPVIVASSTLCSGPDSSCAAFDMEEANALLQMSEVNDMGTDALSDDAIPPKEETEKKGKKGYFGKYWKPKWYRHSPFYRRRSPHPTTRVCNAQNSIVGSFGTYPGYTGNLSSVSGVMSVDTWSAGVQTLSWSLSNVDPRCAEACTATNCCGVHIHVGKTCSVAADIGGHFWNSTAYPIDPWLTVEYNASASPSNTLSLNVSTGLTANDILGRAMVIHDFDGGRIACGIIKEATVPSFSAYPGYSGNLTTVGSVLIASGSGKQTLSWIFQSGLDERCTEACTEANCCGVHIHVGFDCTDGSSIGGHWWNSHAIPADPWQTTRYNLTGGYPSVDSIEVETQLSTAQIDNRTLVIHDFTGTRIACGNIQCTHPSTA